MAQCDVDPDREKKLDAAAARVAAFAREQAEVLDLDRTEILEWAIADAYREDCKTAEEILDVVRTLHRRSPS